MKKIGRPRKAQALRKENISVNLPLTLVSEIESKLSYKMSRSQWVENAIRDKLSGAYHTVSDTTTNGLLVAAMNRPDIDAFVLKVISNHLNADPYSKSKMQAVETVEGQ